MFLNRMESRFLSRLIRTSPKFATKRHWSTVPTDSWDIVPRGEVKRFIVDCMSSVKTSFEHAEKLADNLCAADYRGHYSHGLNRLGKSYQIPAPFLARLIMTPRVIHVYAIAITQRSLFVQYVDKSDSVSASSLYISYKTIYFHNILMKSFLI